MCGIVGCAGWLLEDNKKAFRDMLLVDMVRGQDSTGVLRVPCDTSKYPDIYKDVGSPLSLWDDTCLDQKAFDYRGVINGFAKVLVGHNRAATKGKITIDNAHPFMFGDIYGVHNGTLWNTDTLDGDHEVDSKCIFETINEKGIEHTWKNLKGAAALVWWDDYKETLNIIRNKERDLFWLRDSQDNLYWASEKWMLEAVAFGRSKTIDFKKSKEGNRYISTMFKENHHYEFEVKASQPPKLLTCKKLESYNWGSQSQSHYRARPGYTSSFDQPKAETRSKTEKVNTKWSKGLSKADKSIRGSVVKFDIAVSYFSHLVKEWVYYVVAKMDDGTKVKIFCENIENFDYWVKLGKNVPKDEDCLVKLNAVPRIYDEYGKEYHISSKHVKTLSVFKEKKQDLTVIEGGKSDKTSKEPLYKSRDGSYVTLTRFRYELDSAGGCCAGCDNVLDHDDAEKLEWLDDSTIICGECQGQPWVKEMLGYSRYKH